MADNVLLIGAEDVRRAAQQMDSAAMTMQRSASAMEDTFQRHQQFMTQWLADLERVIQEIKV